MRTLANLSLPTMVAAALSALLTPLVCRWARRIGMLDHPGPRKIHGQAVPRVGGIAVVVTVLLVFAALWGADLRFLPALPYDHVLGLVIGVVPVFVASLWDDIRPLGPIPRLAAQLIGAGVAVSFGISLGDSISVLGYTVPLGMLSVPFTIVWIVGITNAFNIIDGLDGLSAGLALISAISLATLAIVSQHSSLALLSLVLVGALVGFLPYNMYPARVFLGDCGSTSIGFWLACLALPGGGSTLPASMAVLVPLLSVGVPVAETLLSMLRRLLRRMQHPSAGGVLDADAEHVHHRLLRLGFSQRNAVLLLYGTALAATGIGVLSLLVTQRTAGILVLTLLAAAFIGVSRLGYDEFAVVRRGVALRFYDAPVLRLGFFRAFVDMALVALAFYLAIGLKYEDWSLRDYREVAIMNLALALPLSIGVFWMFRMYQRAWRFVSVDDVIGAGAASVCSGAATFVVSRLFLDPPVNATLFGMYTLILAVVVGVGRSSFRILDALREPHTSAGKRAAVYGAGTRGLILIHELRDGSATPLQVVGFIDDDPAKQGKRIGGYPVLGDAASLEKTVVQHELRCIVLASDSISTENLSRAKAVCRKFDIDLLRFSLDMRAVHLGPPSSDAAVIPGVR